MPTLLIFFFLTIVAVTLVTVALGFNWMESRRKKQVEKILDTVSAKPVEAAPSILLDPVKKEDLLQNLLKKLNAGERLSSMLYQSGLDWTIHSLLTASGVMAFVGMLVGFWVKSRGSTSLLIPCFTAGFALLPFAYVSFKRKKRLAQFEEQFPDALDFLGRAMRAGHAFAVSFELICEEMADPLGKEFRTFFNEQNLGAPLETAMANLVNRVPILDVRFFASAVILQRQTGGNLSEILNRLSAVIRERFRLKGHVKAAAAHGKMTSIILTLLPIATMLGLLVVAPGYLQGMAADPDGKHLIIAAIVAQVLGFLVMRKITDIKV